MTMSPSARRIHSFGYSISNAPSVLGWNVWVLNCSLCPELVPFLVGGGQQTDSHRIVKDYSIIKLLDSTKLLSCLPTSKRQAPQESFSTRGAPVYRYQEYLSTHSIIVHCSRSSTVSVTFSRVWRLHKYGQSCIQGNGGHVITQLRVKGPWTVAIGLTLPLAAWLRMTCNENHVYTPNMCSVRHTYTMVLRRSFSQAASQGDDNTEQRMTADIAKH